MRIVTGCPRSGTSFVCHLLQELGGDFGDPSELIVGDRLNRGGYFENRNIIRLNHLLMFGRWSNPDNWVNVLWPGRFLIHARKILTVAIAPLVNRTELVRTRGRSLAQEIAFAGNEFGGRIVKDPRFSYTTKTWMEHSNVDSVLYVFRHPLRTAESLARQVRVPRFLLTRQMWKHNIDGFWKNPPPNLPVHLVHYDSFFEKDQRASEFKTLARFLGRDFDSGLARAVFEQVAEDRSGHKTPTGERLDHSLRKRYEMLLQKHREQNN